jgi:23S rRNA pseudouridine2605 synthase
LAPERLQKILAHRGVASRREAELWIRSGRIRVNGEVVTELGAKADPEVDRILVDGRPLPDASARTVVLLNKPMGYVSTVRDPHAERTVMDLLHGLDRRLYPVGRLDRDSRGVLLLTDDGELTQLLLHPSRSVEKVYEVTAAGELDERALEELAAGVELEDGRTAPARVWGAVRSPGRTQFRVALKEGRKRQVRRMVRAVGSRVVDLVRISFAGLDAQGVPEGSWRRLTTEEVAALRRGAAPKTGGKVSPGSARAGRAGRAGSRQGGEGANG